MAEFSLKLFGVPELTAEDAEIKLDRRKSVALLAYLALADRPQTRDRLASLFWPETDAAHALASLRIALHDITGVGEILKSDRDQISFVHDNCTVDVREFLSIAAGARQRVPATGADDAPDLRSDAETDASDLVHAEALYRDEFLRGFSLKDAGEFDDWLFFTAESLQTQLVSTLSQLVEIFTTQDTTRAIAYAQRLVQLEELDEDNHRALIDLYVTEGRFSAAIRQFERCREVLARELQEEPSSDLAELYESLMGRADSVPSPTASGSDYLRRSELGVDSDGDDGRRSQPRLRRGILAVAAAVVLVAGAGIPIGLRLRSSPPEIPSIMVLPFSVVGTQEGRPVNVALFSGFVESELLGDSVLNVRRAGDIDLPSRNANAIQAFGETADVDFVLDGQVVQNADDYTIAVQLLDVSSGNVLLGDQYTATEHDLGTFLIVVAQEVVASILVQLGPEMAEYLQTGDALLNPFCETSVLLSGYHLRRDLSEGERAQLYLTIKENLIADDYSCEGYFLQVDSYWSSAIYGLMPPVDSRELLRTALDEAGETIRLPETDLARGVYAFVYEGNMEVARAHFQRAHQADPTSTPIGRWWSLALALSGQVDEALGLLDSVQLYSPHDPILPILRSTYLYWLGKYEESIGAAEESIARNNTWQGLTQKGKSLLALGRLDEAEEVLAQAAALPAAQEPRAYLGHLYGVAGETRLARETIARNRNVENDDPSSFTSIAFPALVHLGLGDLDSARDSVRRAIAEHDPTLWLLVNDPLLDPIRDEFESLL